MRISLSRASMVRLAGIAVLTATTLAAGSPASAQDSKKHKDNDKGGISVSITIENDTDGDLKYLRKYSGLEDGRWEEEPPSTIDESDEESFEAVSKKKGGVEGMVTYRVDTGDKGNDDGYIQVVFKNPKKGNSDYDCEASQGLECDVEVDDDDPDEVELTVNVSES